MPPRTYQNFDLHLTLTEADQVRVEVLASPAGEAVADAPVPALTIDDLLVGSGQQVLDWGQEIGAALLPGAVGELFKTSLQQATAAGDGLRLRLRLHDERLSAIPWEAARVDGGFLSLLPSTPLVRYELAGQPPGQLSVAGPLHILGIVSDPKDILTLDTTQERHKLEEALAPLIDRGLVTLDWLPEATTAHLQAALRRSPHVLHYIGHGTCDAQRAEGQLLFKDERGNASPVSAEWLATLLRDNSVRFVFLNACDSGHAAGR